MVLQDTIPVELTQTAGEETRVDKVQTLLSEGQCQGIDDPFIMHPGLLFQIPDTLLHMGLSPSDLYHTLF